MRILIVHTANNSPKMLDDTTHQSISRVYQFRQHRLDARSRFSVGVAGKPCLTLTVTGGGKFSAEDEAAAMETKIKEEHKEGVSRTRVVPIATPQDLFSPSDGRGLFPNLV